MAAKRKPGDPVQLNIQVRYDLRVAASLAATNRRISLNQFVAEAIDDAIRANSPAMKNALWDRLSERTKELIASDLS